MNLELDAIKKELAELKKLVLKPKEVRFFKVYYELEHFEQISIEKLIEDMIAVCPSLKLSKLYIYLNETHNNKYDNPKFKLATYTYQIYFWIILHKPIDTTIFDLYFKTKLGQSCSESFLRYDEFLNYLNLMKKNINLYYEVDLSNNIKNKTVPKIFIV